MSDATTPADDLDEDLFHFDEVAAEAVRAPVEIDLPASTPSAATAPAASQPAPQPVAGAKTASQPLHEPLVAGARPAPVPARSGQNAGPFPASPAEATAAAATAGGVAHPSGRAPRSRSYGRWTWVALAGAIGINLALVGLCWKSLRAVQGAVVDIGHHVMARNSVEVPTQPTQTRSEGWEVSSPRSADADPLERAQEEMEQGQFAPARRRLYALLAICDRLERAERADFEVKARFLIAESWRKQALAQDLAVARPQGARQP